MQYTKGSEEKETTYVANVKLERIEGSDKTRAMISVHVVSKTVDGLKKKLENILTVLDDDDFVS